MTRIREWEQKETKEKKGRSRGNVLAILFRGLCGEFLLSFHLPFLSPFTSLFFPTPAALTKADAGSASHVSHVSNPQFCL